MKNSFQIGEPGVWEGRRLVLARVGITPPVEPGEDQPSPLPYTGCVFPIITDGGWNIS